MTEQEDLLLEQEITPEEQEVLEMMNELEVVPEEHMDGYSIIEEEDLEEEVDL